MMFQYNGYCFEITPNTHNPNTVHGACEELRYYSIGQSYDSAISDFKSKVNEILAKKEKSMQHKCSKLDPVSQWYYRGFIVDLQPSLGLDFYIANCKELEFSMTSNKGIVSVLQSFQEAVDTKLDGVETKKEESPSIKLFKQYHRQLEKLRNEIEDKDYNIETIEKKVNSIFELYGYPLNLGSAKRVKTDLFSVYKVK